MRLWCLLLLLAFCLLVSAAVASEPNESDNSAENDDDNGLFAHSSAPFIFRINRLILNLHFPYSVL